MNPKNLKWTSKKPLVVGEYWWKADKKDAKVFAARVYEVVTGEFDAVIVPSETSEWKKATPLNDVGVWNINGFWAKRSAQTTPKKEHRNSKLARRIKETKKTLKECGTSLLFLRIMAENQLTIMERILEIDKEKDDTK